MVKLYLVQGRCATDFQAQMVRKGQSTALLFIDPIDPTDPFTTFQIQNQSHKVLEVRKIHRNPRILKLRRGGEYFL